MRHCYDCGAEIDGAGFRRTVETGSSRRVYSGRRRTSVSHSTSEGRRTLCATCADSRDRLAAFKAKATLVFVCGAAVLFGFKYFNQSHRQPEPVSIVQQAIPPSSPLPSKFEPPTEPGSINSPGVSSLEETSAPLALPAPTPTPNREIESLLDPNFRPDAIRVQDRLRLLGFAISDPRGVWSKSTDLARISQTAS
jgi:hypothetical protein